MTMTGSPAREVAALRRFEHLGGELVAHDARILKEGVQALEDVIVGAADADPADADQHLVGASARAAAAPPARARRACGRRRRHAVHAVRLQCTTHLSVRADHALRQDDVGVEPPVAGRDDGEALSWRARRRRSARCGRSWSGKPKAGRRRSGSRRPPAGSPSACRRPACSWPAPSTKESSGSTDRIAISACVASAPSSRTSRLALLVAG